MTDSLNTRLLFSWEQDPHTHTTTFLCEGCHTRFPATMMWKSNYRQDLSDFLNSSETGLRNHVCSKKCAGMATAWKEAHHQTLREYRHVCQVAAGKKLTSVMVHEMFCLRRHGHTLQAIATRFQVHISLVSRIVRGEIWKEVA